MSFAYNLLCMQFHGSAAQACITFNALNSDFPLNPKQCTLKEWSKAFSVLTKKKPKQHSRGVRGTESTKHHFFVVLVLVHRLFLLLTQ